MRPAVCGVLAGLLLACVWTVDLMAADWQWPAQMSIGGFNVVDIRGSVAPDGSGTASATLQVPLIGNQKLALSRTPRGEITGRTSLTGRAAGAEVRGDFTLTGKGLGGRGSVKTAPRQIDDASIAVDTSGQISGTGRVTLGALTVAAKFASVRSKLEVTGSAPTQPPSVETDLAVYKFDGTLNLAGGYGRIEVIARGRIERTGKLTNQSTSYVVPEVRVDAADGRGAANVGGISVTFKFF